MSQRRRARHTGLLIVYVLSWLIYLVLVVDSISYFSILRTVVNFLFDCVNRDREKGYALVTLGLMTHAAGDDFEKQGYLAQLISILLNLLGTTKENSSAKWVWHL